MPFDRKKYELVQSSNQCSENVRITNRNNGKCNAVTPYNEDHNVASSTCSRP